MDASSPKFENHAAPSEPPFERLLESVYHELRQIARYQRMDEPPNVTLQTTALVHEAYLRLVDSQTLPKPSSERHMKALTSRVIRHVIVDHARYRNAQKRTPEQADLQLENPDLLDPRLSVDALDLDAALHQLARRSQLLEKVIELRFFGGLTNEEVAAEMDISTRTARRYWHKARLYLLDFLQPTDSTAC